MSSDPPFFPLLERPRDEMFVDLRNPQQQLRQIMSVEPVSPSSSRATADTSPAIRTRAVISAPTSRVCVVSDGYKHESDRDKCSTGSPSSSCEHLAPMIGPIN